MNPDPAQLPAECQLEKQRFHCPVCREAMALRLPPHDLEQALSSSSRLLAVVDRKARSRPRYGEG